MSKIKEYEIMPSKIETIDRAFYTWLDEKMNIHSTTNKGWKKVPVIWLSAERSFQIKNNKDIRDSKGVVKLPLISVERAMLTKNLNSERKGPIVAAYPEPIHNSLRDVRGGSYTVTRRVQQEKSSNFASADLNRMYARADKSKQAIRRKNKKVVYETISVPIPVYVTVNYNLVIRTDYQQQMNEILAPLMYRAATPAAINSFIVQADGHKYEAFIDEQYSQNNNVSNIGDGEKVYETKLGIRVLGYIMGAEDNDDKPKVVIRESAAEVKIIRERAILGDENDNLDTEDGFYRE